VDSKNLSFVFTLKYFHPCACLYDKQDTDKKIKDVRKQYHSNENYTSCGLMTDLDLKKAVSSGIVCQLIQPVLLLKK